MLSAAAGLALLAGISPDGSYLSDVLPGGVLATLGVGCSLDPATIVAVRGVPTAESGLASGIVNTSRLAGGTLGLAALTTSHTNAQLASGSGSLSALTSGYEVAFLLGAACCVLGAIVAGALLREPRGVGSAGDLEPA